MKSLSETIIESLVAAGIPIRPESDSTSLAQCGLDSLILVLTVSELERRMGIKIPARLITEEIFQTVTTIREFLEKVSAR